MMPQDLELETDQFSRDEAVSRRYALSSAA
jgi:hypothetical protein